MSHYPIVKCLACESPRLKTILDLRSQPPANLYLKQQRSDLPSFPLCLNLCESCWHAQLSWNVDRREIFDDYAYVSGTSRTLRLFFDWFSGALRKTVGANRRILEIAANDGSLIRSLLVHGFECVGVDPAKNIVEAARKDGLPLELGYWPEVAEQISGQFDVIVGMNVLAHVDNPRDFLSACKDKLSPEGVIIIQPSQARMIENGEFDTIYHEHLSFFNSRSIATLAGRVGLKLVGTALVKVHGDSPVYFLQHENVPLTFDFGAFRQPDFGFEEDLIQYENRVGLYFPGTYQRFADAAAEVISGVKKIVAEHRALGYQIAFVGAAAKAITLLNAANIRPDYLLDESPLKIGSYAPGCNVLVQPLTVASTWTKPTLFVMSAWNFRKELSEKLKSIGIPGESKFYAYFPEPHWIE